MGSSSSTSSNQDDNGSKKYRNGFEKRNSYSKQENLSSKEDHIMTELKWRNLLQAIPSLKNENKQVRSDIEMERANLQKYKVIEKQLEETKTNLLKKEFECRNLQQTIQSLENENKRVRSDIEMESPSLQKYKVLEKQLEETKTNFLKKEFECRDLQQAIQALENENKQVRSDIKMEHANFKRQTDDLVQQNSDLENQVLLLSLNSDRATTTKKKLQLTIDDLEIVKDFQESKLIEQHQHFQTINTMLLEERNLKERATQRIDELQKYLDKSEKKLFNLEQKFKQDGIKAKENQITLLNNKLLNERNDNHKFKVIEETKYKMTITQLNDSTDKILHLTKQNQKLTCEIEELKAQDQINLKEMTLEEDKNLKQIQRLKDDLLTAEEKITDLENVLEIYQTENMSTEDDVLLKELKTTKILNAYNGIIDLKRRVDKVVQKSEYQIKYDRHKTYENQVKHLKSEYQAMVASLNDVRSQNRKVETLEKNYFKLLQENNNKYTSLSKKVQNIMTLTAKIYQQFLFDIPAKLLLAVVLHGIELDKIEEINVEKLYQKERELLEEIIKALGDESELLETIRQSQYRN